VTTLIVCGISFSGVSVLVPVLLRRATRPTVSSFSVEPLTLIEGSVLAEVAAC
jgi:hypothetical protein